ncbi:MAG TPA: hypothetical protein VHX14_01165 [Thermoanaerobaculia bacterium]|nr:hypothetical protein [Thermoanaerobaculia bacterium]
MGLHVAGAYGADIDHKDLLISGLSLEVDTTTVVADPGIAAAVQTKFGGKINDQAPPDNGMTAAGELTGPGIDTPIPLVTRAGHLFLLPLLYEKGDYVLRNIRLVSADGKTLQTAVPSFANITITQTLTTKLSVHQLTPDELRARGITVDANNYDVFEYTFVFAFQGQTVSVPYPVIIDRRTHEVIKAPDLTPTIFRPCRSINPRPALSHRSFIGSRSINLSRAGQVNRRRASTSRTASSSRFRLASSCRAASACCISSSPSSSTSGILRRQEAPSRSTRSPRLSMRPSAYA